MTNISTENEESPLRFIGCCGAYCKTCKALRDGTCKGCKLGYEKGNRDISKSKCPIKVCCFRDKKMETCADCDDYSICKIITEFYSEKKGYKYKKYRESIDFIREKGYPQFLKFANDWNGPYGRLK
jgi:hypothetical protein